MISTIETFRLDLHEIRRPDSKFRLDVHWWSSIFQVKQLVQELTNEPPSRQHIFHSTSPSELSNSIMLHDLGIERTGYMLWIAIDYRSGNEFSIAPAKDVELDLLSKKMIEAVRLGLQRNKPPTATDEFEGSGGVYFMRSSLGSYISVFKPHDEEQGMPNNPKDHVGTGVHGMRDHFKPGQGCLRELAAYIMDVDHFSSVPITTLVHCEHPAFHYPLHHGRHSKQGKPYPKLGSLQEFVSGAELFEDIGPSLLSDFEVQKIALLDMRILNCDRNAANILALRRVSDDSHSLANSTDSFHYDMDEFVVSGSPHGGSFADHHPLSSYQLIPIDHGYSMPSRLKIVEWDWAWFNYPHISRPVHPDLIEYMSSLNIKALVSRLRAEVNISDDSIFLIRIAHHVLLTGLRAGLTLKDLAVIFVRSGDDEDIPSRLEQAIDEAEENAYRSIELKTNRSKAYSPTSSLDERSIHSASSDTHSSDEIFGHPPLLAAVSCNYVANSHSHRAPSDSPSSLSSSSSSAVSKSLPPLPLGNRGKSWCASSIQLDPIAERRERAMSSVSNASLSDCDSGQSQSGSFDPRGSGADFLLKADSFHEGLEIESMESLRISKGQLRSSFQPSSPSPHDKSYPISMSSEQHEYGAFSSPTALAGAPLKSLRSVESGGSLLHALLNSSGGEKIKRSQAIQIPMAAPPPDSRPDPHSANSPKSLVCFPYGSPYLNQSILPDLEPMITLDDDYVMCNLEDEQLDLERIAPTPLDNYEDILFDVPVPNAVPLSRVVSFSGFESRPLYTNPSVRAMGNLRLERRKMIADSAEFKQLRLDFAKKNISKTIQRIATRQKSL